MKLPLKQYILSSINLSSPVSARLQHFCAWNDRREENSSGNHIRWKWGSLDCDWKQADAAVLRLPRILQCACGALSFLVSFPVERVGGEWELLE